MGVRGEEDREEEDREEDREEEAREEVAREEVAGRWPGRSKACLTSELALVYLGRMLGPASSLLVKGMGLGLQLGVSMDLRCAEVDLNCSNEDIN